MLLLVLTNVMALAWIILITILILIIETKLGGVQELEVNLEMKRAKVSEEGVREEGIILGFGNEGVKESVCVIMAKGLRR